MTEIDYFAKNLKYLRQKSGLKQEDIASIFYVTSQAVSKWETAKSMPDIKILIRIGEYFHYTVEELITKDIENFGEVTNEKMKDKKASVTVPYKNSYFNLTESKETKSFFFANLVAIVFFFSTYVFLFLPIDWISQIIIIVLSIINTVAIVQCIRAMIKVKRHVLITSEGYLKTLQIAAIFNFVAAIWFLSTGLIFVDFLPSNENTLTLYYIIFMIQYFVTGISACVLNIFYNKVENSF